MDEADVVEDEATIVGIRLQLQRLGRNIVIRMAVARRTCTGTRSATVLRCNHTYTAYAGHAGGDHFRQHSEALTTPEEHLIRELR